MELPPREVLLDVGWLTAFQAEHGSVAFQELLRRAAEAYGGPITAIAVVLLTPPMVRLFMNEPGSMWLEPSPTVFSPALGVQRRTGLLGPFRIRSANPPRYWYCLFKKISASNGTLVALRWPEGSTSWL
jgi:hypothetical protein